MAPIEEAIATTLTNSAPAFGVAFGEVYITASGNYLDVIAFHSVVVFLRQLAAWAWLLARFRFPPFAVFLAFGTTGWIDETLFAGPRVSIVAQWLLVYGLMIDLPAYCDPDQTGRRPVRWWAHPVAVLLPILAALPLVALLLGWIAPTHPSIHFAPFGES